MVSIQLQSLLVENENEQNNIKKNKKYKYFFFYEVFYERHFQNLIKYF